MKSYKSHKTVQAAKIVDFTRHREDRLGVVVPWGAQLSLDDDTTVIVDEAWLKKHGGQDHDGPDADRDLVGGYLVRYEDGYLSWSPPEAFEGGYKPLLHDPKDGALPVAGYKPQSPEKVAAVNDMKIAEETILRKLDHMKINDDCDQRWLALGRTHLEQAFMAINRSIFQPGRASIPQ